MDRSFLADPTVIEASRAFVCVRLATFEDAAENTFTQGLYTSNERRRRKQQVNTVFTILAPDGKTPLLTVGRSPSHSLRSDDPKVLVAAMGRIAAKYKTKNSTGTPPIPYGIDLRRSINVAACDMQPLVVVVAKTEAKRKAIEKTLASIAWGKAYVGVFAYTTAKPDELKALLGASAGEGVLVVLADDYGLTGKVVAATRDTGATALRAALKKGQAAHKPRKKDSIEHIRNARMSGIRWTPEVEQSASRPRR